MPHAQRVRVLTLYVVIEHLAWFVRSHSHTAALKVASPDTINVAYLYLLQCSFGETGHIGESWTFIGERTFDKVKKTVTSQLDNKAPDKHGTNSCPTQQHTYTLGSWHSTNKLITFQIYREVNIFYWILKTGQGIETYWSRKRVPYIDYSACKEVLTGSFGTPCLIQSIRMTSCMGRWIKGKETVDVNIHQSGKPRCCCMVRKRCIGKYFVSTNKIISQSPKFDAVIVRRSL